MRIAFIGKGGSGKSTIAGTVARLLARDGHKVLALDIDTLPGLSYSLGLGLLPDEGLPAELAERQEGKGWVMKDLVTAEELVDRYALYAPGGVRLLQLGKLPAQVRPGSTTAFRHVVDSFQRPGWSVIGDLAAGTRQSFFGWARFASHVVIVAETTVAAFVTARRLRGIAQMMPEAKIGLLINKVWAPQTLSERLADLGLPLWGTLPYDEHIAAAEREGLAPIDAVPRSDGVAGIAEFLRDLQNISGEKAVI